MHLIKITGTVHYQNLATGFWGIEDEAGGQWMPINMPETLKKEGLKVSLTAQEANVMTIFMWGTPIEIKDFSIND